MPMPPMPTKWIFSILPYIRNPLLCYRDEGDKQDNVKTI
jgi:hypothetical protein